MELEEIKAEIESRTGVPAGLINGESAAECVAHAKALLTFRREKKVQEPKTNQELFAECFSKLTGIEATEDPDGQALQSLDELTQEPGAYPAIQDAGEQAVDLKGTPQEQFAEFMAEKMAWNPRKGPVGWIGMR